MTAGEYRSLLVQMEWADALIWRAALNVPALHEDRQIKERLHHFHSTQWAYLQILTGRPLDVPELDTFSDLTSVGRWARRFYRELPALREALDETALAAPVVFPWAAHLEKRFGTHPPASTGESLLQLALHTAYHRGQIATALRQAGGDPPLTDFIAWIWMGRPAPEWGELESA